MSEQIFAERCSDCGKGHYEYPNEWWKIVLKCLRCTWCGDCKDVADATGETQEEAIKRYWRGGPGPKIASE